MLNHIDANAKPVFNSCAKLRFNRITCMGQNVPFFTRHIGTVKENTCISWGRADSHFRVPARMHANTCQGKGSCYACLHIILVESWFHEFVPL